MQGLSLPLQSFCDNIYTPLFHCCRFIFGQQTKHKCKTPQVVRKWLQYACKITLNIFVIYNLFSPIFVHLYAIITNLNNFQCQFCGNATCWFLWVKCANDAQRLLVPVKKIDPIGVFHSELILRGQFEIPKLCLGHS